MSIQEHITELRAKLGNSQLTGDISTYFRLLLEDPNLVGRDYAKKCSFSNDSQQLPRAIDTARTFFQKEQLNEKEVADACASLHFAIQSFRTAEKDYRPRNPNSPRPASLARAEEKMRKRSKLDGPSTFVASDQLLHDISKLCEKIMADLNHGARVGGHRGIQPLEGRINEGGTASGLDRR